MARLPDKNKLHTHDGFFCRYCHKTLWIPDIQPIDTPPDNWSDRARECTCGNVAILWDEDNHPRIYVDDLTTVQPCLILYTKHTGWMRKTDTFRLNRISYQEIRVVPKEPFNKYLYVDANIRNTSSIYKERKDQVESRFDRELLAAIQQHKYRTSDGNEKFLRTAFQNPLRSKRDVHKGQVYDHVWKS